jgi:hypothetical protein
LNRREFFLKRGERVELVVIFVIALFGAAIVMAACDLLRSGLSRTPSHSPREPQRISVAIIVWSNWFFSVYNAVLLVVFWGELPAKAIAAGLFVVTFFALAGYFVKKRYQKPRS